MLSCVSDSSPGNAPSRFDLVAICDLAPEPSYEGLRNFAGSNTSCFFQTANAMAAI